MGQVVRGRISVKGAVLCLLLIVLSCGQDRPASIEPEGRASEVELRLRVVYRERSGDGLRTDKAVAVHQVPDLDYWNTHRIEDWDQWADILRVALALDSGPEVNQALEIQGNQARGTLKVQVGEKLIFAGLFAGGRMRYVGEGRASAFPGERNEAIVEVVPLAKESFEVDEVRVLVYQAGALQPISLPPGHPSAAERN